IEAQGLSPLGMFEMSGLGLILFLAGTLYLMTFGQWILPDRGHFEELRLGLKHGAYRADVQLLPEHPLVGQKAASIFGPEEDGKILKVLRNGEFIDDDLEEIVLKALDI